MNGPAAACDGLQVVDLSENLAGPYCAQILGDLGAEVVKVERPGTGDPARAWGPPFWGGESPLFLAGNRNKRSVAVDLKLPEGLAAARRLVARADVVIQSYRAGTAESLGLGAERLMADHPGLVYCSVVAFGTEGPLRDRPGYDPLLQAYGGLMSVTGHPDGPPTRVGTSVVDLATGMWAALGVMAALRDRDRTGEGSHVVASLFDTTVAWMAYHLMGHLGTGAVPGRSGTGLPMIAPYEAFPTADGSLMIAAGNDALFGRLCAALEREELARDPRFRTNPDRVANREALFRLLSEATRTLSTGDLEAGLRRAEVPAAAIRGVDEVVEDPQLAANRLLPATPHPAIPDFRSVALPIQWDGRRAAVRHPPPRPGEHTEEVLAELGYDAAEIRAMVASGAVRLGPG